MFYDIFVYNFLKDNVLLLFIYLFIIFVNFPLESVALPRVYGILFDKIKLFKNEKIENVYEKQSDYNAKTTKVFNENEEQLNVNYKTLKKERKHLDQQLKTLQEYSDINISPENRRLKSVNLINTILIILAIYLIYVIFVDL